MFPETSTDSRGSGAWLARLVLGALLLLCVLVLVLYAGARFIIWPNIDSVVARYAGTVEQRLGTSLTWKSIHSEWSGLRPSIEIIEPVLGKGELATRAARLSATVSLRSLLRGQAELAHLVLDRPFVALRRSGDSISLAALEPTGESPRQSSGVLQWLLQQPDVRIGGGSLVVTDAASRRHLRFDDVALVLRSQGSDHAVRLDIGNANALAASLVLQADLKRKPGADPADWHNWEGNLQLDGRQLATQLLLAQLPAAARAAVQDRLPAVATQSLAGQVDPSLSLQVDDGKIANARIRLRSDDLVVALADRAAPAPGGAADVPPRGSGLLRFERVNLDVRVRPTTDGTTEISASTLELSEAGGARLRGTSPQPVVIIAPGGRIERLQAGFERIDIAPVVELAKLLTDPAAGQPGPIVHRVDGKGELRDVTFAWQRGAGEGPPSWRVRAASDRASLLMAPTDFQLKNPRALRVPDLLDVAGSFEATEAGGKAVLRNAASPQAAATQSPSVLSTPAQSPAQSAPAQAPSAQPAPPAASPPPQTTIRLGGLLVEQEVAFNTLDAQFSWKVDGTAGREWLAVQVDRLVFATADGSASVTGRYRTGGRGAGSLDLRARLGSLQASKVWRYLPHEVPENVRRWLREALESGALEGGEARWRGDIRDFPYRLKTVEDQGEFRFTAKVRDLLLKYSPEWPAIHGIAGDLVFDRASMDLRVERATLLEVPLTKVDARMDDVATGMLEIGGKAQGDLAQMIKFVNTSPLAGDIGNVTRSILAKGPATLEMELGLPLKELKSTTVKGRIDVTGATFDYQPADLRLAGLQGRFDFTARSLAFSGVRGTFAGTPVEVSGKTGEPGTMRMQARGTMAPDGVRPFIGDQLARQLNGSTAYAVDIDFGRDGTRLNITSDLGGLASDLPAPLTKTADAQLPFKLTMAPAGSNVDRIEASLGAEVVLLAERGRSDARRPAPPLRAALAVNRQAALPDQGMSFQFTGQRIDLDAWRQAITPPEEKAGAASPQATEGFAGSLAGDGALPLTVSLVADEVRAGDRILSKVVLGASRTGNLWLANVSAREINGFLTWSEAGRSSGKLTARLGRLEIPKSQQQEIATSLSTGPTTLPAMDISAQQFILGGYDFGTLELVARNATAPQARGAGARGAVRPRVWQLERLRLSMPAAELQASGQWERNTSLTYRLDIKDAGGFLNRLQLKDVVKGGKGSLAGELHWSGSPFAMDLPSLGGTTDIAIRDGQFLKVEPGAAKLIGVLNLQALPKLLTLDFRNIFEQGFAFDELRGNVSILDGVASTDSLAMRGLQAVVQIKGQADLNASTQDLKVVVVPELNGGLATLAYAAIVNPAVGLGAFLAQSLFSQPLSRALAHEIDITGSWSDPKVVERKRERFGAPQGQ